MKKVRNIHHIKTKTGHGAITALALGVLVLFGAAFVLVPSFGFLDAAEEGFASSAEESLETLGDPTCPLNASNFDVLVKFPADEKLIANGTFQQARTDAVPANISAGTYDITFVGYDDHPNGGNGEQDHEEYRAVLLDANGNNIMAVRKSKDIPDNQQYRQNKVSNVDVGQNVHSVIAHHDHYQDVPGPESVTPVCVGFKKEGGTPPPPPPPPTNISCPLNTNNFDTVVKFPTDEKIIANGTLAQARTSKVSTNIAPGTYDVTFVGYDDHPNQGGDQKHEEYRIVLFDNNDNNIGAIRKSLDIPNDQEYRQNTVRNKVINTRVRSVLGHHDHYQDVPGAESLTPVCAGFKKKATPPPTDPKLTIDKTVINDDGGTLTENDFTFEVWDAGGALVATFDGDKTITLPAPGMYYMGEKPVSGYEQGLWGGDCTFGDLGDDIGQVYVGAGEHKTCTITNDDIPEDTPPTPQCPLTADNDDILVDFTAFNDPDNPNGKIRADQSKSKAQIGPINQVVPAGDYKVTLTAFDDHPNQGGHQEHEQYKMRFLGTVDPAVVFARSGITPDIPDNQQYVTKVVNQNLNIPNGVTRVDAIHALGNSGDNPESLTPVCAKLEPLDSPDPDPKLTIDKTVINDDGGVLTEDDFTFTVKDANGQVVATFNGDSTVSLPAGTYTVSEAQQPGYTASPWGTDCTGGGMVTLANSQHKTCTITNNDSGPTPKTNVAITKDVTPDGGNIGQVFTYTLTYENTTNVTAHDVRIEDVLANASILSSFTITKQPEHGSCSAIHYFAQPGDTHMIMACDLGTLKSGQSGTITYTLKGIEEGTADNTATIETTDEETTYDDNEDDARVTIVKKDELDVDISITKDVTPDEGEQGDKFTYTLVYKNHGPLTANQVTIRDRVVEEHRNRTKDFIIIDDPEHGDCDVVEDNDEDDIGIDCDLGSLQQGEEGTIKYEVKARVEEGTVDNNVEIKTTTDETNLNNNKDSARIRIEEDGGGGCTSNCGGGGGGGSSPDPDVDILSTPRPQVLGTSISLAQVPYTGVGSTIAAILFVIGLLVISGGVTYWFLRKRVGGARQSAAPVRREAEPEVRIMEETVHEPVSHTAPVATAQPVQEEETHYEHVTPTTYPELETLEHDAREKQALLSTDAARTILDAAGGNVKKAQSSLVDVIEKASGRYPTEDGWLLLNQTRVADLLFSSELSATPLFIQWLLEGNQHKAFAFLRTMTRQGREADTFLGKVIYELDRAYQARLEGAEADRSVVDLIGTLSNAEVESLITSLTRAVDGGYTTGMTGAKVALTRIFEERAKQTTKRQSTTHATNSLHTRTEE